MTKYTAQMGEPGIGTAPAIEDDLRIGGIESRGERYVGIQTGFLTGPAKLTAAGTRHVIAELEAAIPWLEHGDDEILAAALAKSVTEHNAPEVTL